MAQGALVIGHGAASAAGCIRTIAQPGHRIRRLQRLRQSEVQHLHDAIGSQLDVGGLQVAVDDALLVRGFEGFGDLLGDGERFINRNRTLGDAIRQRRPLDQFHHQRDGARALFEAVNLRDVGMVQGGEDFSLALKPRESFRVAGD